MAGFDYLDFASSLPDSANLVLLYVMYKVFFAIDMLLPLSLVFAMIGTKIYLIRSNALVSFYSLGYSKTQILAPFVVVSVSVVIFFISLHATSFARADEFSNNIRKYSTNLKPTHNLFFSYEDKYIYFGELQPLAERAKDVRVFIVKDEQLHIAIVADSARYDGEYWVINGAYEITKPLNIAKASDGVDIKDLKSIKILKGFRPKIIDQVHAGKVNYTIGDAFDAIMLLRTQNVSIDRIKSAVYKIFIYPFFVPSLIIIIFFFVPISSRSINVSLFSFGAILATLLMWGVLFALIELSNNKTISSELGIVSPVVVLAFFASLRWYKASKETLKA